MLKSKIVPIPAQVEGEKINRDAGRSYLLSEMPALKAERWARHAFAAMNRNDLDVRGTVGDLGMLGFYLVGLQALAGGKILEVDDLMDEMLDHIKIVESENVARPIKGDGDVWEITTLYTLRKELIELHMGFTFAELASMLVASAKLQTAWQSTQTSQS